MVVQGGGTAGDRSRSGPTGLRGKPAFAGKPVNALPLGSTNSGNKLSLPDGTRASVDASSDCGPEASPRATSPEESRNSVSSSPIKGRKDGQPPTASIDGPGSTTPRDFAMAPSPIAPATAAKHVEPEVAAPHGAAGIYAAVRIRPFSSREHNEPGGTDLSVDVFGGTTIVMKGGDRFGGADNESTGREKSFTYDAVFSSYDKESPTCATQETVFEALGVPMLTNALNAYNGCLLAYGQTGAGKSHSMMGDIHCVNEKGLLPRACERLFEMVDQRKKEAEAQGQVMTAAILTSYLEIYQEKMYDLLQSTRTDLQVRIHPTLGPHVPSLTETPVRSTQDVHELFDFGTKNRAVGATCMNASSSRSHAVFSIDLRLNLCGKDLQAKMHFVDLAGSEKQKKTQATGERLQEGIAINQSLSALSRVIQALACPGKGVMPPFRESKLTLLLKDALCGNSRTTLLACITPSKTSFEESIGSLEFASRCKQIKTHARKNEQDKRGLIEGLTSEKEEVQRRLEAEMAQRFLLQEELEREAESSRGNKALVEQMRQEKLAIEMQLRQLELQASEASAAAAVATSKMVEEDAVARKEEWEKMQEENRLKAQELLQLQHEQETRAREQQIAVEAVECQRLEKEKQFSLADAERQEAVRKLEHATKEQEEQQLQWAERQQLTEKRAKELEEALHARDEESAERKRLELEREEVIQRLKHDQEDKAKSAHEAERLRKECEEELRKMESERLQAETQLEAVRLKQAEQQNQWGVLNAEKELQSKELQELRRQQAEAEERQRQELEAREKANQARHEQEVERLQRDRAEELSRAEEARKKAIAEMQDKLAEVSRREEDERKRVGETQRREEELRQRIEVEMKRVQTREEDLQKELSGLQGLTESLALDRQKLEDRAQEQKEIRQNLLNSLGIMGIDGQEDSRLAPRLMNLHPDPMLEGCLIYYLPTGETRIGADNEHCRVCLTGLDVADQVCVIINHADSELEVRPFPGGLVRVNGIAVPDNGQVLQTGDRVAIGRAYIFRVVVPKSSRNSIMERAEKDFSTAMQELQEHADLDPRWRRGVDAAILIVKRDYGTHEANALLFEAKRASEVVAEANSVLKSVPAEWTGGVSHYELAVLFEADGPPVVCVVARDRRNTGAGAILPTETDGIPGFQSRIFSAGIWEAVRFTEERLPLIYTAVDQIKLRSSVSKSKNEERRPQYGDWQCCAFGEVPLQDFQDLSQLYSGLQEEKQEKDDAEKKTQEAAGAGFFDWLAGRKKEEAEPAEQEQHKGVWDWPWVWGATSGSNPAAGPSKNNIAVALKVKAMTIHERSETLANLQAFSDGHRPASLAGLRIPSNNLEGAAKVLVRRPLSSVRSRVVYQTDGNNDARKVWPAAHESDGLSNIIVGAKVQLQAVSPLMGEVSPRPLETGQIIFVEVRVEALFDGKLGMRLRSASEGLTISGFDVPEAAELGWQIGDEISYINGKPVATKEDFRRELTEARKNLPVIFTVSRLDTSGQVRPRQSVTSRGTLMDTE